MILVVVTRRHRYTIRRFVRSWGRALAGVLVPVAWERVARRRRLPHGTWIFADLERLDEAGIRAAARLHDRVGAEHVGVLRLNDPRRTLRRRALLDLLHRRGVNSFRAFPAGAVPGDVRWPVFLRRADDHAGNASPLLHTRAELEAARRAAGPAADLVVEFVDASDARGIHRKYAAFRIGDRIVPRHLFFSRHWMVKKTEVREPALLEEEWAYVRDNPHEDALREIFDAARVDYGRVDYTVRDGRLEVFEINTNPMLASATSRRIAARHRVHERAVAGLVAAFEAIRPAQGARA